MKLFYTGADKFNNLQPNIVLSLGGFISSTPIPNAQLSNLFSDISSFSISKDQFTVIAIALQNTLAKDVTDIFLWFDFLTDAFTKLEFAFVDVNDDSEGNLSIEKLSNSHSLPFFGTFQEASGEANKVNIGDLLKGQYLGLYIKQTFLPDLSDKFTCDELTKNIEDDGSFTTKPNTKEDIVLNLDWTEV